jgi:hypothetical protein
LFGITEADIGGNTLEPKLVVVVVVIVVIGNA